MSTTIYPFQTDSVLASEQGGIGINGDRLTAAQILAGSVIGLQPLNIAAGTNLTLSYAAPTIDGQGVVTPGSMTFNATTQSGAVSSVFGQTGAVPNLSGDATTTGSSAVTLANTAVAAGSYGNTTNVATYTVDAKGRLTAAANAAIAFPVTSVFGTTGAVANLSGDVTTAGSSLVTLADTAVIAGTYGNATNSAQITVDSKGRVTAAVNVPISGGGSDTRTTIRSVTANTTQLITDGTIFTTNTGVGDRTVTLDNALAVGTIVTVCNSLLSGLSEVVTAPVGGLVLGNLTLGIPAGASAVIQKQANLNWIVLCGIGV